MCANDSIQSLMANQRANKSSVDDTARLDQINDQLSTVSPSNADSTAPNSSEPISGERENDATVDFDSDATRDFELRIAAIGQQPRQIPERIGQHKILGLLGRGGMGVVYLAYDERLQRKVALKMMLAGEHASPAQILRFANEAKAIAQLKNGHIVQVFDSGIHDQMPYFSLEFVDGQPLDKLLRHQTLPEKETARLMHKICLALQYAHDSGILHRDLKPGNVLLTTDGEPKVADFGLARIIEGDEDPSARTKTGTVMGTPSYMSPEQAIGDVNAITAASDQYSLGAMMYEMLTGRPPFTGANHLDVRHQVVHKEPIGPRELQPKLSVDIEVICLKALQKDLNKRYASCSAMAEDLARFLRNEPILARPVSQAERLWRWCRRNPVVASLTVGVASALLAIASLATWAAVERKAHADELTLKNSELQQSKDRISEAANELQSKNETLAQRTQRLQDFVQTMFANLRTFNVDESPRSKPARDQLLSVFNDIMIQVVQETEKESAAEPLFLAVKMGLVDSLIDQQRTTEAEAMLSELKPAFEARIKLKDGSDSSRNNLALWASKYGGLKRDLRRDKDASLKAYQQALDLAESIVREPKASADGKGKLKPYVAQSLLGDVHNDLGVTYYRFGDPAHALEQMQLAQHARQQAIEEFEKIHGLNVQSDNERQLRDDLIAALEYHKLSMGATLFRSGNFAEAEPLLKVRFESSRQALDKDPGNPSLRNEYVGQAGLWAEFLGFSGRDREALDVLESTAKELKQLLDDDPHGVAFSRTTTVALYRLSQWRELLKLGNHHIPLQRCVAIRQTLAQKEPDNDRRQLDLMLALARSSGPNNPDAAADAHKIVERFLNRQDVDPEVFIEVARALCQLGVRQADKAQSAELIKRANEAIERARAVGFADSVYLRGEPDLRPLNSLPAAGR